MVLCVWDHIYSSVSAETLKKSSPLRLSGGPLALVSPVTGGVGPFQNVPAG